jgi:predicted RNase H-like HicB family nuclease
MSAYDKQAQRYLILVEGGPSSNYSAWSPDLPGCAATGETVEEVEREMRAAIALHLERLAADGESIPEPSGPGFTSNGLQWREESFGSSARRRRAGVRPRNVS